MKTYSNKFFDFIAASLATLVLVGCGGLGFTKPGRFNHRAIAQHGAPVFFAKTVGIEAGNLKGGGFRDKVIHASDQNFLIDGLWIGPVSSLSIIPLKYHKSGELRDYTSNVNFNVTDVTVKSASKKIAFRVSDLSNFSEILSQHFNPKDILQFSASVDIQISSEDGKAVKIPSHMVARLSSIGTPESERIFSHYVVYSVDRNEVILSSGEAEYKQYIDQYSNSSLTLPPGMGVDGPHDKSL